MEKSQTALERRQGYKKSGVSAAEAADKRRQESTLLTRQRRDVHMRAKRMRLEQSTTEADVQPEGPTNLGSSERRNRVAAVVASLKSSGGVGSKRHLEALQALRQLTSDAGDIALCETDEPGSQSIFSLLVSQGAIPLLIAALKPSTDSGVARQAVVEAAWALTNMAASEHKTAEAVLQTTPLLIAHLSGGFGIYAAEQSAWALGNLAGDCRDFRERLLANGAMLPLVRLMLLGRGKCKEPAVAAAAQTAAWALSNLIKSAGAEVKDMLAVDGCPSGLCELLQRSEVGLITEVAWVTAYASASQQVKQLLAAGILAPLLANLSRIVQQWKVSEETMEKNEPLHMLATPVLRSIGNLIAAGTSAADMHLLLQDGGGLISDVMSFVRSSHRGLQKEALWVLSNVTGQPGRAGVQAVIARGAASEVVQLLREAAFPVRKEAAFVVANLCAGGGDGSGDLKALQALVGSSPADVHRGALPGMVELLTCPDPEAAFLALQFVQMVLGVLPDGPQIVEAADGILMLEELQMKGNEQQMSMATQLLDQYFGDDYMGL